MLPLRFGGHGGQIHRVADDIIVVTRDPVRDGLREHGVLVLRLHGLDQRLRQLHPAEGTQILRALRTTSVSNE
jgi:hypothetical protein